VWVSFGVKASRITELARALFEPERPQSRWPARRPVWRVGDEARLSRHSERPMARLVRMDPNHRWDNRDGVIAMREWKYFGAPWHMVYWSYRNSLPHSEL